jgi:hypothetical protein
MWMPAFEAVGKLAEVGKLGLHRHHACFETPPAAAPQHEVFY